MALNACTGCTTKFAVGLKKCPHCGSTEFVEDGSMAKITVHGGPSDKTLTEPETAPDSVPEPEVEGGEQSSPGTSSSTSTEKPPENSATSSKPRRKPARTTASRSAQDQTDDSSADSTVGEKTELTSETGSDAEDAF